MIKLLGLVGLAVAAVSIGCISAANVKGRIEELVYVKRLMKLFHGELRYKNVMLTDAFMAVAHKANGVYKDLFGELAVATEDNYSLPMARVFGDKVEEVLKGHTLLNKEDIRRLKELGETLGYQDQKMQLANIELYIDRLTESIEEDRKGLGNTVKMYRTLGVMGALMCVIVFM